MPHPGLTERTLRRRSGMFERTVRSLSPAAGPARVAILFLDGKLYVEKVGAADVVRQLQKDGHPTGRGRLPVPRWPGRRHEDFLCRPDYARFVAHDLVGSVREERPGLTEIAIVGLSLTGLAAAYNATRHPAVFRAALCQPPSFWWEQGRFVQELSTLPAATPPSSQFLDLLGQHGDRDRARSHPPSGLRQQLPQVTASRSAAQALPACGYGVNYPRIRRRPPPGLLA